MFGLVILFVSCTQTTATSMCVATVLFVGGSIISFNLQSQPRRDVIGEAPSDCRKSGG